MKKMMYFGLWERAKTIGLVRKKETSFIFYILCIVIGMTAGTYTYIHVDRSSYFMTLFGKTR
jgi:hypothetical protein